MQVMLALITGLFLIGGALVWALHVWMFSKGVPLKIFAAFVLWATLCSFVVAIDFVSKTTIY